MNGREAAYRVLAGFARDGAYVNGVLNETFIKFNLDPLERSFATELTYGCLKNLLFLDYGISRFSKVKIRKMSVSVRTILEIGAYQILKMSKVPDSAACDESVKLARKYAARSAGFVNGVLRSLCRGKNAIEYPKREDNEIRFLSVMFSFPEWIVRRLLEDYGGEICEKILDSANRAYPPYIRQNSLKELSPQDFRLCLSEDGIETEPEPDIKGCYRVLGHLDISKSDTYKKGFFTIQNKSSQLAAFALEPRPGMLVADMCAGPGGKTCHIAELMKNRGEIRAFDIYGHKIDLINSAAERLGIDIIKAEERDGTRLVPSLSGKADRVLIDAPCSGLGVVHSKPDIRWTRKEEDIEALSKLQKALLDRGAEYVKQGGIMVYSTCTLLKGENERQAESFLERHGEFELVSERRIMTYDTGGSGFYIAKFVKTRSESL